MAKKTGDFFEYLKWRGDLSFCADGLREVDALIFTQLSYLDFGGLISENFTEKISLSELAKKFKESSDFEKRKNPGLVINELTVKLLFECAKTERFGNVYLSCFKNNYDATIEEQFCAVTYTFLDSQTREESIFVAFRGTDDTLVGWKEDFNLAIMDEVPAQTHGCKYLNKALKFAEEEKIQKVYCGGHSKGGNLAVYASAKLSEQDKNKLAAVYNFDGPGFSTKKLECNEFKSIENKIHSVYPQFSIIGMLFHHFPEYKVVKSTETLVMQHDPFSWGIMGPAFDCKKVLDDGSEFFYKTFNGWFEKLTSEKKVEFVETIFSVLEAPNARDLNELSKHWHRNALTIIKAIANLDSEIRKSTLDTAGMLFKEAVQKMAGKQQ